MAFPAKAEQARHNAKVGLLYADPIGEGMADAAVVLVQGHARVRDADVQANTAKFPAAVARVPGFVLARMGFYFERIWVEVTPLRIRWWSGRDLSEPPRQWVAAPGTALPSSDPAPTGHAPPPWRDAAADWRPLLTRALAEPALVALTVVDTDGYPLCVPVRPGLLDGDRLSLVVGRGAPAIGAGPACLIVHSHGEVFTSQANLSLVGQLRRDGGLAFEAERTLGDWSVPANRLVAGLQTMAKGRKLSPLAVTEAARRGQPVPRVRVPRPASRS